MIVIRPIAKRDLEAYITLSLGSQINMLSMPKDARLLEGRLNSSLSSFQTEVNVPDRENYLFVAIDSNTGSLVGVAGITATCGGNEPLYFFRIENIDVASDIDGVTKKIPVLNPVSYIRGPSEIGSLFVLPEARQMGIGKLLSFSRFLFVAAFSSRFTGSIITELRGKVDGESCPFWDMVGRKFFDKSVREVTEMLKFGRSFVGQFLPKYPIYINLLPYRAQEVIGQPDEQTKGAYSLLKRLGFEFSGDVDVVDGGPKLSCRKENIAAIKYSQRVMITDIHKNISSPSDFIIANELLDFRACYSSIRRNGNAISILDQAAEALEVDVGDYIRILDLAHFEGSA